MTDRQIIVLSALKEIKSGTYSDIHKQVSLDYGNRIDRNMVYRDLQSMLASGIVNESQKIYTENKPDILNQTLKNYQTKNFESIKCSNFLNHFESMSYFEFRALFLEDKEKVRTLFEQFWEYINALFSMPYDVKHKALVEEIIPLLQIIEYKKIIIISKLDLVINLEDSINNKFTLSNLPKPKTSDILTDKPKRKKRSSTACYFEDSEHATYENFSHELQDWTEEKIKYYYDAAINYSNKGKTYKNWILAVRQWDKYNPDQWVKRTRKAVSIKTFSQQRVDNVVDAVAEFKGGNDRQR